MAAAKTDDDKGPIGSLHVNTVMDAMNHEVEVDALRRNCPIRGYHRVSPRGSIGIRRIVAHHTIFGIVAQRTVHLKRNMALVATVSRYYLPARCYGGAIHGEVSHLVVRPIGDALLRGSARQDNFSPPCLNADGVSAVGVGGNGVLERVGAGSVTGATGAGNALRDETRRGHVAAEAGVSVLSGGAGHGQRNRTQLRQGERVSAAVFDSECHRGVAAAPP